MTAEVVILNKGAVALAADSTVTIGRGGKTYNSVNKLFSLSKYEPVGAMIFGNADFIDVPWETLIKEYRRKLGTSSFDTVADYVQGFVEFLEEHKETFFEDRHKFVVYYRAKVLFDEIKSAIDERVRQQTEANGTVSEAEIREISDAVVTTFEGYELPPAQCLPEKFIESLELEHDAEFQEARNHSFDKIPLSDGALLRLKHLAAKSISHGDYTRQSGLIFAGFGKKQVFPEVVTITPSVIALGKLIFRQETSQSYKVSLNNLATLVPFAQRDVVWTFLNGIDPSLSTLIETTISRLFEEYPRVAVDAIEGLSGDAKEAAIQRIKKETESLKSNLFNSMRDYKKKEHLDPLLQVIAVLPKDELAAMAEALVNLTSVKRKMSLRTETVGGPIDVAVISKGDGFVWISRKHYFRPELNPLFFKNYLER